jgi:hypothetical protein
MRLHHVLLQLHVVTVIVVTLLLLLLMCRRTWL